MNAASRWPIAVFLSVSVLASFTTYAQSVPTARDQAVELTRGFLAAQAESQSSADPGPTLVRLSTLAQERRNAMAALVATEPASFLSLAISSELRDALPASIRNRIEERTEVEGDLEVIAEDYDWGSITRYHVRTVGRGRLALHFAADAPGLLSDQRVRIRGVLLDQDMAIASGTADVEPLASVLPSTFGEQRTLLMLVNFIDNSSQPFSLAAASDLLLNTVSSFYRENSQNQTWIGGDIVGWFTINVSVTVCDTTAIMNAAKAAASGAGADLSRYRRFVVTFPQNACGFAGMGNVGGTTTNAWINGGNFGLRTLGHELGHNLGLHHAHALECGSSTLGSSCATVTYGNPVDIMGVPGIVGHFNAFAKERLGWLDYGSSAPLLKVTSAGTFTLSPYASTLSGLKAIKVLKSMSGSVPTYYYVEYRHGANFDSTVPAGVFVHTGVEGNGDTSHALDMTPETESWNDAALPTGRTFTDPASGLSITTMSVSGSGATVRIDFGGPLPCSYSLSAASESMSAAGGSGSVNLTTGPSCWWGATSNATWLTPWAASGTGSATVQYTVAANTTSSSRSGTLTIGGQPYSVTQAAGSCTVSVSPLSASFTAAGGSASVSVSTNAGCPWTAEANQTWTAIVSGASGSGNGTVNYTVEPNSSTSARNGSLTVAGQAISISQAATVATVNHPPSLAPIAAKKVSIGGTLAFTISGSDPDGDTLTYSASNLPSGAVLNASTGAFYWVPISAGTYNITFRVSDGQLSASQIVKVTVSRLNRKSRFDSLPDEIDGTADDGEALGAPREVSARVSGDSLRLMWLPAGRGRAPSGYLIEAGSAPGLRDLASIATGTAATSFVTAGVPPGRYYVRLRSAAGGRTSAPSEEISITIGRAACTVAPAAPLSLQSAVMGGQVALTWAGGSATSYQIEVGSAPGLSNLSVLDTGSSASSFATSAPPGVYHVRVKARNACGASVPSAEVTVVVRP